MCRGLVEMSEDNSTTTGVTTDQLIASIGANLRDNAQMDTELSDILAENILRLDPCVTAVNDAVKAVEALATKRAEEPDDEPADHD
jgi:hypothetical protein